MLWEGERQLWETTVPWAESGLLHLPLVLFCIHADVLAGSRSLGRSPSTASRQASQRGHLYPAAARPQRPQLARLVMLVGSSDSPLGKKTPRLELCFNSPKK